MSSQEHKENSIRFIDSGYNEKFRVNDGDKILIHTRNGTTLERECKYIDDYHTQIGSDVFHICEFAELCERNCHTVEPPAGEKNENRQKAKKKRTIRRCKVVSRKYELISELYDRTCKTVVSNPQNWQNFLRSACRNYKLRYDEQLLIYSQRPDATAVLEIERWNRNFGRWVNKGARGIAVFADENRARQRLTHYFDISDTHESRYSRPVPLWDMRDEYTDDVIETLESTFGELDNKVTLGEAVMSAAQNAAEDNLPDYLNDLIYASEDSFLEGLDETMIASLYKKL